MHWHRHAGYSRLTVNLKLGILCITCTDTINIDISIFGGVYGIMQLVGLWRYYMHGQCAINIP